MIVLLHKIQAYTQLIRPELPAAAGVCVVLGQALALGHMPSWPVLLMGAALGFTLSTSAMIFNDLFDLPVDRVNTPQRPLPSGRVTPTEAVVLGVLTGLGAFAIALAINPLSFGLSILVWVLGFLYNWMLKSTGLLGNLIVSTNVAMTFVMGGVSVGQAANPLLWIFSLIAFCFDLAEEIAGDAMDMQGDRERGSQSLAIVFGKQFALRVSAAFFGAMILLTLAPIFHGETSPAYWAPILLLDALVVFFTLRLLRSQTPQEGRAAMRGNYISASLGLLAFLIARFTA